MSETKKLEQINYSKLRDETFKKALAESIGKAESVVGSRKVGKYVIELILNVVVYSNEYTDEDNEDKEVDSSETFKFRIYEGGVDRLSVLAIRDGYKINSESKEIKFISGSINRLSIELHSGNVIIMVEGDNISIFMEKCSGDGDYLKMKINL